MVYINPLCFMENDFFLFIVSEKGYKNIALLCQGSRIGLKC